MKKTSITFLMGLIMTFVLSLSIVHAKYPERPIQLIVPWAAGGGTDNVARTLAVALEQELGQPVNVVNRPGGSGVVGHAAIMNAKPDGYTIGLMTAELNMMHWLGLTDFTYENFTAIAQVNADYAGVQVKTDSKYQTIQELLDDIREKPAHTFTAAGSGQGGIWHIALGSLLLDQEMDPQKVKWIPTEGANLAMLELVAGGVDFTDVSLPEARSMTSSGKARNLAYMSPERNPAFSDVPTLKEEIGSDLAVGPWRGIGAPKDLDAEIVETLEKALEVAYQSELFQDFMAKQGLGVVWRNAQDFATFLAETDEAMGVTIEKIGLMKK